MESFLRVIASRGKLYESEVHRIVRLTIACTRAPKNAFRSSLSFLGLVMRNVQQEGVDSPHNVRCFIVSTKHLPSPDKRHSIGIQAQLLSHLRPSPKHWVFASLQISAYASPLALIGADLVAPVEQQDFSVPL